MKQWEYRLIDSNDVKSEGILRGRSREAIEQYLNELGAEGWEIITLDWNPLEGRKSFSGVAKRPKSS